MARVTNVAEMKQFSKLFRNTVAKIAHDALYELVAEIKSRTPIDTSKLINNWQLTHGSPATSEVTSFAFPAYGDFDSQLTYSYIDARNHYYITNLVEYAYAVEFFGGSNWMAAGIAKKPAMMVRVPIMKWDKIVDAAASRHKV